MKTLILVIASVFTFSCTQLYFSAEGEEQSIDYYSIDLEFEEELLADYTLEIWNTSLGMYETKVYHRSGRNRIVDLISKYVVFQEDTEFKNDYVRDDWKLPNETLRDGTGDYEDYAILYAFLLQRYYGQEKELVIVLQEEPGKMYLRSLPTGATLIDPISFNFKSSYGVAINKSFTLEEALHIADSGVFRGF